MTNQKLSMAVHMNQTLTAKAMVIKKLMGGSGDESQRFIANAMQTLRANPKLLECTEDSVMGSLMTMASLRLMPSNVSGEAYLIPYGNTATFQLGYQGIVTLVYRAGAKDIVMEEVRAKDTFRFSMGKVVTHELPGAFSSDEDRGEVIGYYVIIRLGTGGEIHEMMSVKDVEAFAKKYSKAYAAGKKDSPWSDKKHGFHWMAKKTVFIQAAKRMPKNDALFQAISADMRGDSTIKDPAEFDRRVYEVEDDTQKLSMGAIRKNQDDQANQNQDTGKEEGSQEDQNQEPSIELGPDDLPWPTEEGQR